jgi:hypothetical protein
MGKRVRRPQARKTYTRLGARKVTQGLNTGTYQGGFEARVQTRLSED